MVTKRYINRRLRDEVKKAAACDEDGNFLTWSKQDNRFKERFSAQREKVRNIIKSSRQQYVKKKKKKKKKEEEEAAAAAASTSATSVSVVSAGVSRALGWANSRAGLAKEKTTGTTSRADLSRLGVFCFSASERRKKKQQQEQQQQQQQRKVLGTTMIQPKRNPFSK